VKLNNRSCEYIDSNFNSLVVSRPFSFLLHVVDDRLQLLDWQLFSVHRLWVHSSTRWIWITSAFFLRIIHLRNDETWDIR